ncbi:polysaccharide pyruvyl transferase family protein [Rufibacter hautae]|uniref:Polysaccharide pyruvyl transferase family protein n=1 Tax=Rufibacter hautae TaxID=2595005 RepID=A0A5B6THX3_9BACT|nr:polysaccharide pyruvyl transferase family protein [Rufibacter hautae]KAA3439596.1 polysaccharide pyruvyl transferase family protein [Rufibacter hautae]
MKYYYQIEGDLRNNIGDVLQGMVAKNFLPTNALVVNREAMAEIDAAEPGLLVANGWYMHSFDKFPPPENIQPVYVSVHIAQSELLSNRKVRDHFKKHAPIGCRDAKTLKLFLGWGIPAYYSSCLTITTAKRAPINTTGKGEVLLVDNIDHPIPEKVKQKLEGLLGTSMVRVSHDPPDVSGTIQEFMQKSEPHMNSLLERYCRAALVVTTKIHCALPCLGMGANVMLIHPNPSDPRLATVAEFLDIVSYEEVLAADSFSKPVVNLAALTKKKEFLSSIVTKSVAMGGNVMQSPDTAELQKIKQRASLMARLYRMGVKAACTSGLANEQMKRVFSERALEHINS